MFDDQIKEIETRLINGFDTVLKNRISQFSDVADDKIDQVRELINGFKMNNQTTFEAPQVKKAKQA